MDHERAIRFAKEQGVKVHNLDRLVIDWGKYQYRLNYRCTGHESITHESITIYRRDNGEKERRKTGKKAPKYTRRGTVFIDGCRNAEEALKLAMRRITGAWMKEVTGMWRRRTVMEIGGKNYVVDTAEIPKGLGGEYETMIFRGDKNGEIKNPSELYCRRYTSERAAEIGHDQVVKDAEKLIKEQL